MAAFNWFKRSYEEPKDPKESASENASKVEPEQPVEEKQEETPASSEDYLNWAKAAYQNIQSRQTQSETQSTEAEQTQAPEDTEKETVEDSSTQDEAFKETASEDAAQPVEAAATVEASTAEVSEPVAETEPDVEAVDTEPSSTESGSTEATETDFPEADAPVVAATDAASTEVTGTEDADAEATEVETEADSVAARPFWAAQAEQERIARLERLQAEAILEPEPEPAAPEQEFVPLDIDLDEAFLWSAEVLASQGRRPDQISVEEITWLNKLRQGLDKTRRGLVNQLKSIVGQGPLNDEAVDEIEALLLQADVGVAATDKIISALQSKLKEETLPPEQAIGYLKSLLRDMLEAPLEGEHNLTFTPEKDKLSIWLMTGVNGAGKTTTIGKLAHIATKSEFKCLIGAADTFRAAAVEQVKVWGDRSGVEVIANPGKNTDPAAVVFDAISAANSRDIELLLIDTAGRLQNKKNLMDELSKVRKIIDKKAPDANVESLLVLDATLGQNGLRQAQVFAEAAQLSGVVLTKLDGTARGGVALAVVEQLGLPIRFIGAGEGIEDLRPFSSYEFIEALLSG
ncbi:signal recognition particle-docking protein FtsY [cf. Phormidesmis sp. LEGE 11477]|uniref:signal recognition particle-docking protein FtsY n=1 Tax=cf. Phormidesmis sp. LEGE 11477 TaxID=1828680 RepID=UPI001880FB12|nr:signal recognition particle-docking protein FtsY [cf. Phormidesmis sp. LEGE 11477]MBE9062770.1 signal recognition particle-docking protein FtsY [cf. Phormidesmis sp. LEGE 11477]